MISMRSPTAARIFSNGSIPLRMSLAETNAPPAAVAKRSNGQIFMAV